jgi:hypothetical protein
MAIPAGARLELEVKANSHQNNSCQYQFQITSHNTETIDTSDLRIRYYIASNFRHDEINLAQKGDGFAFGGATGSITTTVDVESFDNDDIAKPPRIATTTYNTRTGKAASSIRFNQRVILTFSSNTLDASGEGINGMYYTFGHTSSKNFDQLDGATRMYAESYSYDSSTTYVSNKGFILEGWNGSAWVKLTTYTDSSTEDTQTGVYPYGDTDVDDTAQDHLWIAITSMAEIREGASTSNFGTADPCRVDRDNSGGNARRVPFDVDVSSISDDVVKAEAWFYMPTSSTDEDPELVRLDTGVFVESEVSWDNWKTGNAWTSGGGDLAAQAATRDISVIGSNSYQLSHLIYDITTTVDAWYQATLNKYGLIAKFVTETGGSVANQHTYQSDDNVTVNKRPRVVVAVDSAAGPGPAARRVLIV